MWISDTKPAENTILAEIFVCWEISYRYGAAAPRLFFAHLPVFFRKQRFRMKFVETKQKGDADEWKKKK